jgi:hypothetical protein
LNPQLSNELDLGRARLIREVQIYQQQLVLFV